MDALDSKQQRTFQDEEIKEAIRTCFLLPKDSEIVFQIDGTALAVWTASSTPTGETKMEIPDDAPSSVKMAEIAGKIISWGEEEASDLVVCLLVSIVGQDVTVAEHSDIMFNFSERVYEVRRAQRKYRDQQAARISQTPIGEMDTAEEHSGFNAGVKEAAAVLQRKAAGMHKPIEECGAATSNFMALLFEEEAKEILALCRK